MPIPFGRERGSAFATTPRPKLPACLVEMLLLANHPTLKLRTPCPKQRAEVERQHCMRKILSVSLISNLRGALTCATMLWELIRSSQEMLFLIGCSTGSKMMQLVHCEHCFARPAGEASVVVPSSRCVLAHICLKTRTESPLSHGRDNAKAM